MVGFANWRYGYRGKLTTDDVLSIDVRTWQRECMLLPGARSVWAWSLRGVQVCSLLVVGRDAMLAIFPLTERGYPSPSSEPFEINIERTACPLGGYRSWFTCPNSQCNKRVAILYWVSDFRCRHCLGLKYPSENEDSFGRAIRRIERCRRRLGWKPGVTSADEGRPKGMHVRRYKHLTTEYARQIARLAEAVR